MSTLKTMAERRSTDRAPIELTVEYQRLNTFFSDYTRNISRGGTFIQTDRPLKVGTEFIFALRVPRLDEPLRLHGKVKWVIAPEAATATSPSGMGIEFLYETADERRNTEVIVEDLMLQELGETLSYKLLGKKPNQSGS